MLTGQKKMIENINFAKRLIRLFLLIIVILAQILCFVSLKYEISCPFDLIVSRYVPSLNLMISDGVLTPKQACGDIFVFIFYAGLASLFFCFANLQRPERFKTVQQHFSEDEIAKRKKIVRNMAAFALLFFSYGFAGYVASVGYNIDINHRYSDTLSSRETFAFFTFESLYASPLFFGFAIGIHKYTSRVAASA
ncbi:hypothetical protein DYH55_00515 [Methylovirgula sp. 4M-Z18]|nr:hypothetical protein DYH55_00515 [Methylovirgula sp. 4M-Z18]